MEPTCTFCGRAAPEAFDLPHLEARCCPRCATTLGRLLADAPELFLGVWPGLVEDDDGSREPHMRLPDGTRVAMKDRTAALKEDLTLEKRVELAGMYGQIGLHREQLLEAAHVLANATSPELARQALDILFAKDRAAPDAVARLRRHLLPC